MSAKCHKRTSTSAGAGQGRGKDQTPVVHNVWSHRGLGEAHCRLVLSLRGRERWWDYFLLMSRIMVWCSGMNTFVANRWRWDHFLILGRRKLLTIVGSGRVLALGNSLLRRVGRTSEGSLESRGCDEGQCRP